MSSRAAQIEVEASAPGAGENRSGRTRQKLSVLSRDAALLETLRVVADGHEQAIAGTEAELAGHLIAGQAGVLILDTDATSTPVATLTGRLKEQFPDTVLIVAGGAEDQGALAAQVTSGVVHRFLHKPVSEQRVRLFVEAAWRRHHEEHAGAADPSSGAPRARSGWHASARVALPAGSIAALCVLLAWLVAREPAGTPPTPKAPDPAGGQTRTASRLEPLLARADAALERGAWAAPAGENAAELYAQVLKQDPGNERAGAGLEQVVDRLLTAAERALLDRRVEEAATLTDAARRVDPAHVRVAFLTTQIGKERERAVLAQARKAAAGGDIEHALAVLDGAVREGRRSTLVAEARLELEQRKLDANLRELLRRARERMDGGALVTPAQDNARFFIESARALAPADPRIADAQRELLGRLLTQARAALAAGDAEAGERWAAEAGESGASQRELGELRREAQSLRIAAKADAMARTSQVFNQRLAEAKLLEPAADSARFYLEQLVAADAGHPSTVLARQALGERLLAAARDAGSDETAARRWLDAAREIGLAEPLVANVERELAAARARPERRPDEPVPASALERLRYVAPEYPAQALQRGTRGWVEIEFTVRPDGTVGEARVAAAQPARIFDRAAVDAVRRWRFRPVERDGAAIEQRSRVRVVFALNE